MNDSTNTLARFHGVPDYITQPLANLAEACARSSELLAQNVALGDVASNLLASTVRASHLKVSRAEAIFFNRLDSNQRIVSIALPDLIVDAMRKGDSVMAHAEAAFFTRHDSLAAEHELSREQNEYLRAAVTRLSGTLSEAYQAELDRFWEKPVPASEDNPQGDSAVESLFRQQSSALENDLVLCGHLGLVSAQEQRRLSRLVDGSSTEGVFGLTVATAQNNRTSVPSAYVLSESVESGQPSGVVFLILPAGGIERFESVDTLREGLTSKLQGQMKDALLLRDQEQLGGQPVVGPHAWAFEPLNDSLIDVHVRDVRRKQAEDCRFLLARKADGADQQAFYSQLDRVRTCAHLDESMGQRFNAWIARLGAMAEPHWRKYGDAQQKAHLIRLEQTHDARKDKVDELFGDLQSFETFARTETTRYMRQRLGRDIDPSHIKVFIQDSIELKRDQALTPLYQYTLLQLAIHGGLPHTASMGFSPSPDQLHADFSSAFVKHMLDELNLHERYEQALEQRINDEDVLRAMTHHRDSAIALSAHAAKMQGHLLQERSHALIHLIRGDMPPAGTVHSIGSLHLTATDSRFRDMIVIEEKTPTDEHFVLYAPGAPDGRDFFEFGSWRALSHQVGEWLAVDSGRQYLHDQLSGASRFEAIAVLDDVQLKPSLWRPDSCRFEPSGEREFEPALRRLVHLKASSSLAHLNWEKRPVAELPSSARAAEFAKLNARITALNREFAKLSPELMSLRDYVQKETSKRLNDYLQSTGYKGHVDPGTLYLGLGTAYTEQPDFGKDSDLRSLIDLMIYGNEDIRSYSPLLHVYSSAGLDVTQFPITLIGFMDKQIREADLSARYMEYLTSKFLDRKHPLYYRRKALLGKRIQYEMTRGALLMFHQRHLNKGQYTWLCQAIDGLTVGAPVASSMETTAVSAFKIAGQVIEGVYIFRNFSSQDPDYNLLYTPGAPDGVEFRPLSDYARLLNSEQMQRYYAARVSHAGQKLMGEFLDQFIRGRKHEPDFVRIHNRPEDRITHIDQLYGDLFERLIADVDSQTESVAEKRMALAYTIIKWTGTIILLPFPELSFGWGLLTTTLTFVEAFDVYASGDRAAAIPLFISGAIGIFSGADEVRTLIMGGDGLARMIATRAGLWAWKKLDMGAVYRLPA